MDEAAPKNFPILSGFPLPPVGTRSKDKRKAEVADRAFAAWQQGEYGTLRQVAEAFLPEYYGNETDETYYESRLENLMRRLRAKLRK